MKTPSARQRVLALEPTASLRYHMRLGGQRSYRICYEDRFHSPGVLQPSSPFVSWDTPGGAWKDALRVFEARLWQQALSL